MGWVMKLVELVGLHIEATSGAPLVLLREHDAPHRVVPIFVGGPEAASIALGLSGQPSPRPLTHDVMASLVDSLDARVEAVEVTDLRDGAFFAAISVTGPAGEHRLDTRPSDAIALAVRLGAPLFVSDEVLDEAGAVIAETNDDATIDDSTIDETVAEFRDFLDELDPADFADVVEQADLGQGVGERPTPPPDEPLATDDGPASDVDADDSDA
jgi:bifunctional DNase/RNase